MRLAMAAIGDQPRLPKVLWVPDTNYKALVLTDSNIKVTVNDLRICYENLLSSMLTQLHDPSYNFGADNLVMIIKNILQENSTMDRMSNQQIGYSFITEPSNQYAIHRHRLLSYLLSKSESRQRFTKSVGIDGSIVWNKEAIRRWLKEGVRLQKRLLTAIHITYGQPSRGEELASLLYSNSLTGDRSIYWMTAYETIMIATPYSKSRQITASDRYTARYLPKDLSYILMGYLVFIRPLEW